MTWTVSTVAAALVTAALVSAAPAHGTGSGRAERYSRLPIELQNRYRQVIIDSYRPATVEERARRIMRGWDLFSGYCRICHGFSELRGRRSEMELIPALSDGDRLYKPYPTLLRIIYFGQGLMPSFGVGVYDEKLHHDRPGYAERPGAKRLTPEEAMDIVYYLRFCHRYAGRSHRESGSGRLVPDLELLYGP
ncbi:MAG TPA: cytochrome c [Deltaproteobacteria bacterium]|nr:cytochrome c [Deltaproteobacteria bacterium]